MQGLNGRVCNPKKQTGVSPGRVGQGSPGGLLSCGGGGGRHVGYCHRQGQTLLAAGRSLGAPSGGVTVSSL